MGSSALRNDVDAVKAVKNESDIILQLKDHQNIIVYYNSLFIWDDK